MSEHEKINYVELPARNIDQTKTFFSSVFGWRFEDYGPEYVAFFEAGVNGGFYASTLSSSSANGSALVVLYSERLEYTMEKVVNAGGDIIKPVFSFPGGRRFHFADPNGNEFAVWSDKETE